VGKGLFERQWLKGGGIAQDSKTVMETPNILKEGGCYGL